MYILFREDLKIKIFFQRTGKRIYFLRKSTNIEKRDHLIFSVWRHLDLRVAFSFDSTVEFKYFLENPFKNAFKKSSIEEFQ